MFNKNSPFLDFSSVLYLTKVIYLDAKNEILVEFSSPTKKLIKRFNFFPFVYLPNFVEKNKLIELILKAGFKNFGVEEENNKLILKTINYSNLKKICSALSLLTNLKIIVIEPERSFLIQKNWSYFDVFEKKDDYLFKLDFASINFSKEFWNKFDLSFFLTKELSFNLALSLDKKFVFSLIESTVWSNLLLLPQNKIPSSINQKIEIFLENLFFKNTQPIRFEKTNKIFSLNGFEPIPKKETLSKIDFSSIWLELFSKNFFNLGPDTINCTCCVPVILDESNLLPSSLIRVNFLEDNFFFESSSEDFSKKFHLKNNLKEVRASKKKEFFLNSFPAGPFFREDSFLVPLSDAKELISQKRASLVSSKSLNNSSNRVHELIWFCKKKESFFSKEVNLLNSKLVFFNSCFSSMNSSLFPNYCFGYYFLDFFSTSLNSLFSLIPLHLTNSSSKFFSPHFSSSINSIQEETLHKFHSISKRNGFRVLHLNKSSGFVKGSASLKLVKLFSTKTNLPSPKITSFLKQST